MPMMAGYMMGSMLGGRGSMMSQPLYRSNQGTQVFGQQKIVASAQLPGELGLQVQLPTVQALKPQPFHAEDLDLLVGGSAQVPPKLP